MYIIPITFEVTILGSERFKTILHVSAKNAVELDALLNAPLEALGCRILKVDRYYPADEGLDSLLAKRGEGWHP